MDGWWLGSGWCYQHCPGRWGLRRQAEPGHDHGTRSHAEYADCSYQRENVAGPGAPPPGAHFDRTAARAIVARSAAGVAGRRGRHVRREGGSRCWRARRARRARDRWGAARCLAYQASFPPNPILNSAFLPQGCGRRGRGRGSSVGRCIYSAPAPPAYARAHNLITQTASHEAPLRGLSDPEIDLIA
jgi:hypothetical protein